MNRKLFYDAIRIYLNVLLCEAERSLGEFSKLQQINSFNAGMAESWDAVVSISKRLVDTIKNCQHDDEAGIHPYFLVSGLAVISKVQECLQVSISAMQHNTQRTFAIQRRLQQDVHRRLCLDAIRSSKLFQNCLVAERNGDEVVAQLWFRAAELFRVRRFNQESIYTYSQKEVQKALQKAELIGMKATNARLAGKLDLEAAAVRAAHLQRLAVVHFILKQKPSSARMDSTNQLFRATSLAIDVIDVMEEKYCIASVNSQAGPLLEKSVDALNRAINLTLELNESPGCTHTSMLETQIEADMCLARRLRGDALNLSQLIEHVEDQRRHAHECNANAISTKNIQQLERLWTCLQKRYENGVIKFQSYFDLVVAGHGAEKATLLCEEEARNYRSSTQKIHSYVTLLAAQLQSRCYYNSMDTVTNLRAQLLTPSTDLDSLLSRRDELAKSSKEEALQYLDKSIDAGLLPINTECEIILMSEEGPQFDRMNCYKTLASFYLEMLTGSLTLAQQHLVDASKTLDKDLRWYLISCTNFLLLSVESRRCQLKDYIENLDADNFTTSQILSIGEFLSFEEAHLYEEAASAWERTAQYWYTSRQELVSAVPSAACTIADTWKKIIDVQEMIADNISQLTGPENASSKENASLLNTQHDTLFQLLALLRGEDRAMDEKKIESKRACLTFKIFLVKSNYFARLIDCGRNSIPNWSQAVTIIDAAIKELNNETFTDWDKVVTCQHAAYYAATAAETWSSSKFRAWDGFLFQKVADHLYASIDKHKYSNIYHIMQPLHRTIVRFLLETAASVDNVFSPTFSAPCEPLPSYSDNSEILGYAEDIVISHIAGANSMHSASICYRDGDSQQWRNIASLAQALAAAQVDEVTELCSRTPDPTAPSTYENKIKRMKIQLEKYVQYATYLEASPYSELVILLNLAMTSLSLADNSECSDAHAQRLSDYYSAAADAYRNQHYAFSAANKNAGDALKKCLVESNDDGEDDENGSIYRQQRWYISVRKEINRVRYKVACIQVAAESATIMGPQQIIGKLYNAGTILTSVLEDLEKMLKLRSKRNARKTIDSRYKEVDYILKRVGFAFCDSGVPVLISRSSVREDS